MPLIPAWGVGGVFSIRNSTSSRLFKVLFAMGPQPLSNVRRNAIGFFGTKYLMEKPAHAALIMALIAFAAETENYWAWVISDMYPASERRAATAMYQAVMGGEGRRSALTAVGEAKLTGERLAMFKAAEKLWKPIRNRRNDFAHHLWGVTKELPDDLLLMDPKDNTHDRLGLFEHVDKVIKQREAGKKPRETPLHKLQNTKRMQVWTPDALASEVQQAGTVCQFVFDLCGAVREGPRGETRRKLRKHPFVKAEMASLGIRPSSPSK